MACDYIQAVTKFMKAIMDRWIVSKKDHPDHHCSRNEDKSHLHKNIQCYPESASTVLINSNR